MQPSNMMQISEILQHYQLSDIKATDANGDTILHLVVKNEKLMPKETIEILGILLDEGLDPNIKNNKNETILHLAIANRAKDVIEFLLTRKIHFEDSLAAYLIKSEKDKTVDYRNSKVKLPMSHSEWENVENESTSFVEWCLSKGLNIDGRNSIGETGFFSAFDSHLLHILPTLLKYTKDFDFVDCDNKHTLLHTFLNNNASRRRNYISSSRENWYFFCTRRHAAAVVRMMLDKGVSTDAVDFNGNTALHLAIQQTEDISIIEMLIERSVNVNLKNDKGQTPFLIICTGSAWYWSRKSKTDDLLKICHHLLTKGADFNEPDIDGTSPLCHAVKYYQVQTVAFLRKSGADFSVITKDGKTLLHILAKRSYVINTDDETKILLFDMLISNGCKVNAKDNTGNTALHLAADSNDVVMVTKLIEHGAEIDARNNEEETPLCHLVHYNSQADAAILLLEHGANIYARNLEGFTALHVIVVEHNDHSAKIELLQNLLKHGADFNAQTGEGYSVLHMALWQYYNNCEDEEDQIEPHELPSLEWCIGFFSDEVEFLLKHWIKLHAANLKCHTNNNYKILISDKEFRKYLGKCLEEVKTLKSTFIDSRTSLYSVLHMDLNSRRAYIYNEKLQQLVQSPKLEEQFPELSVLIFSSYHEAVTRKTLLEPVKETWLEITKIILPDICIERIFSFLSNSDLFKFIEKDWKKERYCREN